MSNPALPEIPAAEVPSDAVLLDVREDDEWAAGHAPTAVHVSMTTIAGRLAEIPAQEPLYVVCRAGGRSARVATYLQENGWDVINVAGGMQAWAASGKPLTADSGSPEII